MTIESLPADQLAKYAAIPIAFQVNRRLVTADKTPRQVNADMSTQIVDHPFVKDYDEEGQAGPLFWADKFEIGSWKFLIAKLYEQAVGGIALLCDCPEIHLLEGRSDLALIWDIRVAPQFRAEGVGRQLIQSGLEWAGANGCTEIKVETQDINVGACKFYQKMGFELDAINPGVYSSYPDEVQLLWKRKI